MNRIERAVIMAAGEGNRMHPLTRKVPKPLISVCGERMIDTVIRALRINGITEIYVVVGYRKEDFASLTREYPGLTLIENPDYHRANNISSLHAARAYLENAMILDADQIIVLDNGRIAGKGTHKELLQSCEIYKEIALSQLSEEELGRAAASGKEGN